MPAERIFYDRQITLDWIDLKTCWINAVNAGVFKYYIDHMGQLLVCVCVCVHVIDQLLGLEEDKLLQRISH